MLFRYLYILCCFTIACELLTSCSSDDPEAVPGAEVRFDAVVQSRASVASSLNYPGSKFAIYGDMKFGGASSSSDNVIVFDGVPVTYGTTKWTYAEPQYWFPNHEHSFVAVYPYNPAGVSDANYNDNSLTFSYSLPEQYANAQDLMVATHRRMYDGQTATPVALNFSHIMSRINFVVNNDNAAETVKATKIELTNVNRSGTFSIAPAALLPGSAQTDDFTSAWTDIAGKGALDAVIDVDIPQGETRPLFPDGNALFVIPQPGNNDIGMKMTCTLMFATGGSEDKVLEAAAPIGGWEPGKAYTYTVNVTPDIKTIMLTVSVTDWEEGPNDNVTVPRK